MLRRMPRRAPVPSVSAIDRRTLVDTAHRGWPEHGGSARRIRARAALARLLWNTRGERRLPTQAAFDRHAAALARGDLEWLCEFNGLSPIYLVPTTRWVRALADELRRMEVRRVVEVAAGDGFLSAALAKVAPDLEVIATDSGAWEKPEARMSEEERKELAGKHVAGLALGGHVRRMEATRAIRELKPDLVLASWLPPGPLLDRLIRSDTRYVLEIGAAGGVTSSQWSWRFAHDFLTGPLEDLARCRLDERPMRTLHSRVTLYFGRAHEEHYQERVGPDDWLWQFRPAQD